MLASASAAASTSSDAGGVIKDTIFQALSQNVHVVGSAWMLSSSLITTYSTTKFLKYREIATAPPLAGHGEKRNKNKKSEEKKTKDNSETKEVGLMTKILRHPRSLPRPTLLTLYRFSGSLALGLLLISETKLSPEQQQNQYYNPVTVLLNAVRERVVSTVELAFPEFAFPAFCLFVANLANSVSLNRIGISLTYTTKCCIPILTAVATYVFGLGALPPVPALISLLPIAAGIAAASWNAPSFESTGFAAALISCIAQTALNLSSKRAIARTNTTGPKAQRAMVLVGLLILLVTVFLQQRRSVTEPTDATTAIAPTESLPPPWLSLMAITGYHIEYVLSFMFVGLVAPVTYGAADAVRRLAIIVSGQCMFPAKDGKGFTNLNLLGIGTALVGALSYALTSNKRQ